MEECDICGKEFSNLAVHKRMAHGIEKERPMEIIPVEESEVASDALTIFLNENELTLDELKNIIRQYKQGDSIPATQAIKRNTQFGEAEAGRLKNYGKVETQNLHVAEALIKNFNFKCVKVDTDSGRKPKTWFLKNSRGDS